MKYMILFLLFVVLSTVIVVAQQVAAKNLQVKTKQGILEGQSFSGIRSFKGIPFAAPPVGKFRWREPMPVANWSGVRQAKKFGPRAMQRPLFSDMIFRSDGMSEDCLYLNVWTPAKSDQEKLPVLVYFYGGGLMTGDGSESRYDGESMARKGIVAITVNYRLSVFGFFAHPELTRESPHQASGNYGLLDQAAALKWVRDNVAAFGGDPNRVTIAGESAGSFSVSAQMASPLSKSLIAGAIGESGSLLGKQTVIPLKEAEEKGLAFGKIAGAASLEALRKLTAEEILAFSANHVWELFRVNVDGYFFTESPDKVFAGGGQAKVPLLVGWNSEEGHYSGILGDAAANPENWQAALKRLYGDKAAGFSAVYAGSTETEIRQAATDLAGDQFIGYSTWKWADLHSQTGGKPVYRYYYTRPRPALRGAKDPKPESAGAVHSAEIEYALGNLPSNRVFDWQPEDYRVSEVLQGYFVNFIRTGNPNGQALPVWTPVKPKQPATVLVIDTESREVIEQHRDRYLFLDKNF